MPRFRTTLAAASLVLVGLYTQMVQAAGAQPKPSPATVSSEADLKDLIRKGIAAYRAKDYQAARAALLEATKLSSDPLPIGILADTEMKLKLYRDAAAHWSIYLRALGNDQSADRAEAAAQLEACKTHVGSVVVSVQPSNAAVLLDGNIVDLAATSGELWLEPGTYEFGARGDGGDSLRETVTIRAGEKSTITVAAPFPAPAAASTAATTQTAPLHVSPANAPMAPDRGTPTKTYVLIGGTALTAVAAGLGTVYFLMNHSAKNDADSASRAIGQQSTDRGICATRGSLPACADLDAARDKMTRTANISDYSFVTAGILGAATIVTYLLWPTEKSPQQANLIVSPYWSPNGQGVTAKVVF